MSKSTKKSGSSLERGKGGATLAPHLAATPAGVPVKVIVVIIPVGKLRHRALLRISWRCSHLKCLQQMLSCCVFFSSPPHLSPQSQAKATSSPDLLPGFLRWHRVHQKLFPCKSLNYCFSQLVLDVLWEEKHAEE